MCSGSEAGSYLRLLDSVYHSTLGLRVIKKKKKRFRVLGWKRATSPKGHWVWGLWSKGVRLIWVGFATVGLLGVWSRVHVGCGV